MRFRVLGPSEVVDGDRCCELGPPKQRTLLALLLMHANEVLSTDRIVDALWNGHPPESGRKALHVHMAGLRAALEPHRRAGDRTDIIETTPQGYVLHLTRDDLDATVFEDRLGAAEEQLPGDPAVIARILRDALGLWRGRPYEDVAYEPFAQGEIRRLDELRFRAWERLVDAELDLGRPQAVVERLDALVDEQPSREAYWGQLMLAQYRLGSQAKALRTYRRAEAALEEFGAEPSAELADLRERIRRQDPTLASPTASTTLGNLPSPLSSFVGREADVAAVCDLVGRRRLVTLVGAGGVGKSRLAVEAARTLAGDFADGAWLIEFGSVVRDELVPSRAARVLGVTERPGQTGLIERSAAHLRERCALLVMDNCEHVAAGVASLVAALLAQCPEVRVIVTSRRPLAVEGEVIWWTEPLETEVDEATGVLPPAVRLFCDRARAAGGTIDETPVAVARVGEVCRRLGGLPLAIELAAARLHMISLAQLAARLDDELALLTGGPTRPVSHHHAMRATIDWSYRLLGPVEQALLRRLAVFRGPFTLHSAERYHRILPDGGGSVFDTLGRLVEASMLSAIGEGLFVMLEPIRQYALDLLRRHDEQEAAQRSHAEVYREVFRTPDGVIMDPRLGGPGLADRFLVEIDNIRSALARALESGDVTTIVELGAAAAEQLEAFGHFREGLEWLTQVLAAPAPATQHRARALFRAVFVAAAVEGVDRAAPLAEELAEIAEVLDDELWRAAAVERMSTVACFAGDIAASFALGEEAAARLISLGVPDCWLPVNNLMELSIIVGDFDQGEVHARRLADIGRRLGVPHALLWSLVGRARIAASRGDADAAEGYLRRAADARTGGVHDHIHSPDSSWMTGSGVPRVQIALLRGDNEAAEAIVARFSGVDETPHPQGLADGGIFSGLTHLAQGRPQEASAALVEVLAEVDRLGLCVFEPVLLAPLAAARAEIDPIAGATLLAAVDAVNQKQGRTMEFLVRSAVERAARTVAASLEPDEMEAARATGAAMTLDQTVANALEVRSPVE